MNHVDMLCRLIEFDTSGVDGRGCVEAITYLEDLFAQSGCQTSRVSIPVADAEGLQGRVALLAHRRAAAKPRLIIYGHIDVVPAENWEAFTPRYEDGVVYGRGASDMKGSLVALLAALMRIRDASAAFDLTTVVTMDEETHQMGQLRYLTGALEPGSKPHVLSLDAGFGYVSIANLGLLQLDVTVSGQSVHSALAHLGRNAVEDAAQLMQPLLELRQQVMLRKSSVPLHPETGLRFMEPRLNINRISGGIARNVVPDRCSFTIDRRLIPEETVESARDEIVNALGRCDGVRWSITREFSIPSVPPSRDAQVRVLADAIANVTGTTGVYGDMLSGELPAAARHFWGAEAFATGVIRPGNRVHGVDEFVRERDLDQLAEVLARFLTGDRKEAA